MMPRLFPREGIYIDPICSLFAVIFLNPPITATAAWYLHSHRTSIAILLAAGVLYHLNAFLNRCTRNNWRLGKVGHRVQELVLLTGGSSGIGAATTAMFAARGVEVIVLDMKMPSIEVVQNPLVHYFCCNIGDEAELSRIAQVVKEKHGHPTTIVNNAGIAVGTTVLASTAESTAKTFEVNIQASFAVLRHFLPAMVAKNSGHVVTISSLSTIFPIPRLVDYAATKAGLMSLHEGLGYELRTMHDAPCIRMTALVPSFISTPLFRGKVNQPHFLLPLLHPDTVAERIVDQVLSGEAGGVICLPGAVSVLSYLRAMPPWVHWFAANVAIRCEFDFKYKPGGVQ